MFITITAIISGKDETGGDARGEFWIKPQKETNLGVAQPFWPLKEIILNLKKVKRIENT